MTTQVLPSVQQSIPAHRRALRDFGVRRLPAGLVGLAGAGLLMYGVTISWLSTFGGLLTQSGWGTRNGMILFYGGVAVGTVALAQLVVASAPLRWVLALGGFGLTAFSGWLLIQLYTVSDQLDGMTLAQKGNGLFVTTAGAAVVFFTIFLPMPAGNRSAQESAALSVAAVGADRSTVGQSTAVQALDRPGRRTLPAWLVTGIGSRLRFPAALLALVAGLAHVPVTPEHLNEAPYIGVSFIALTVVCALSFAALLLSDSAAVWLVIGVTCGLAVVAYVVSRTVGLPLMGDDVGNWLETLGVVSVTTETGVAVLSAYVLTRKWRSPRG